MEFVLPDRKVHLFFESLQCVRGESGGSKGVEEVLPRGHDDKRFTPQ